MYKKLYEHPAMDLHAFQVCDVIVMSGGTGFDTDEFDNWTSGGIDL